MFPQKMTFVDNTVQQKSTVLLYHIFTDYETLETYGTCWDLKKEFWITVPIHMLTPITDEKQILTE